MIMILWSRHYCHDLIVNNNVIVVNYNASYENYLLQKVDISVSPMHDNKQRHSIYITLLTLFTSFLEINWID